MQFLKTPLHNMHVRIKQGVRTVDSLHLKLNRYMMPIMLATVTCKTVKLDNIKIFFFFFLIVV